MSLLENIIKNVVLDNAYILEKEKLSPSAYRIRISSENLKKAEFVAGYFLRLGIGIGNEELSMKDKIRSYSVWDINKSEGYLDIAIATESNGAGSQWAITCKEEDHVYFKWKKGNFLLDNTADSYLFIGDLSALSHFYAINRALSKDKKVESLIYAKDLNDLFADIDGTLPFDFHNIEVDPIENILTIVKNIVPKLSGKKIVYIAGDSRVCVALNQYFRKELNWETKNIKTKPFWNPTKKGLE